MKRPLKSGMYFNTVLSAQHLGAQVLDEEYPGWDKDLRITRCELIVDVRRPHVVLLRGQVEAKPVRVKKIKPK
jgi:hypothetical protein